MVMKQLRPAITSFVILTVITGVIYPLLITGVGQVIFPQQANGSLIEVQGEIVGSSLIGQTTDDPRYFWSRPSAVNTMEVSSLESLGSSGATNYGSTSATLKAEVEARESAFRVANNVLDDVDVPVEMLFASGSGLDPHISPEAARVQVERVAQARNLNPDTVMKLVEDHIEAPQLGFLGQPRVNVLLLNLALDELQ